MKHLAMVIALLALSVLLKGQPIIFNATEGQIKAQCPTCKWEIKHIENYGDYALTTPDASGKHTICYMFYNDSLVNDGVLFLFDKMGPWLDFMDSLYADTEVYTFPNLSRWEGVTGNLPYSAYIIPEKYGRGIMFYLREPN